MTTLITGGASQTGLVLARRLTASSHRVLFGARSSPVPASLGPSVRFDWNDPSTFSNPFDASSDIQNVYLLRPIAHADPFPKMQPFIDLAVKKGVKKFVLLSSTLAEKGPDAQELGRVHTYLDTLGVDYVTLRPTWFIENFQNYLSHMIKASNTFQTVIPKGKIPFVSTEDIGQAAYEAIVNPSTLSSNEVFLIGPDLLSYDEVAEFLTTVLGRKITHTPVSVEEQVARLTSYGIAEDYARLLTAAEQIVDSGSEEKLQGAPNVRVGVIGIKEWLTKHKDVFEVTV